MYLMLLKTIKDYMKITRDETPKPYLQGGSTVVSRPQEFKTRFRTPSPFLDTRYNANDEESKNKSTYIGKLKEAFKL